MGEQNSGKSWTWRALFDTRKALKTFQNLRRLKLNDYLQTDVYLFYSSPQENKMKNLEFETELLKKRKRFDGTPNCDVKIVLCSLQTYLYPQQKTLESVSKEDWVDWAISEYGPEDEDESEGIDEEDYA